MISGQGWWECLSKTSEGWDLREENPVYFCVNSCTWKTNALFSWDQFHPYALVPDAPSFIWIKNPLVLPLNLCVLFLPSIQLFSWYSHKYLFSPPLLIYPRSHFLAWMLKAMRRDDFISRIVNWQWRWGWAGWTPSQSGALLGKKAPGGLWHLESWLEGRERVPHGPWGPMPTASYKAVNTRKHPFLPGTSK